MPPTLKTLLLACLSVHPSHFLMHAISYERCMLGFWNLIFGFLMEKKQTHVFNSPELQARRWAYSIARHLSSVNIFKQHFLRSHEADSYHISPIASKGRGTNNIIFCPNQIRTLIAMATCSCHWLIMGKNENWHLLLSHCKLFLQNLYRNVPWVVLYQAYLFCYNLLRLVTIGKICEKIKKKKINWVAVWVIQLKLCSIVSNISLYKEIAFYCRFSCTLVPMAT